MLKRYAAKLKLRLPLKEKIVDDVDLREDEEEELVEVEDMIAEGGRQGGLSRLKETVMQTATSLFNADSDKYRRRVKSRLTAEFSRDREFL